MKQIGWLALLPLEDITRQFPLNSNVPATSDLESHYPPDFEVNSNLPLSKLIDICSTELLTPTRMNLYVRFRPYGCTRFTSVTSRETTESAF